MTLDAIEDLVYRQSGLKGLSGLSSDMRELEAAGTLESEQAIAYFVHMIRRELGALTAILGGLDTLVFCGGIGENGWHIRERVCQDMAWLGLKLDTRRNRQGAPLVSMKSSRVAVRVIPTNEEAYIAAAALRLMRAARGDTPSTDLASGATP
jgi:acetate kinase